jgi:hypothetical protein
MAISMPKFRESWTSTTESWERAQSSMISAERSSEPSSTQITS